MVKRYVNWCQATHNHLMMENATGRWIKLDDYQALQAALREALDAWEQWAEKGLWGKASPNRIDDLRKQFLDI